MSRFLLIDIPHLHLHPIIRSKYCSQYFPHFSSHNQRIGRFIYATLYIALQNTASINRMMLGTCLAPDTDVSDC